MYAIDVSAAFLTRSIALAGVSLAAVWLVHRLQRARHAELEALNQRLETQTDSARRAARRAVRLHQVTGRLVDAVGEAAVLQAIAREARRATEAAACAVVMPRSSGAPAVVAADGFDRELLAAADELLGTPSPIVAAVASGEPVWIEAPRPLQERFPELVPVLGPSGQAWAALPLHAGERQLGAIALSFDTPGEFEPEDRAFMLILAQQCAQAIERAQLNERSLRARVRAEFAERRLAFLADASARLSASLDYQTALDALAHSAVPDLADWCLIHLRDGRGLPRLVALVGPDAERTAARRALEDRLPGSAAALSGFDRVIESGLIEHAHDMPDHVLRAVAHDDDDFERLRSLGIRSQLTVPITVADDVCGTLTLAIAESGREFADADVTLAAELGHRAGQAVQNAKLYAAAHHSSEAKSDFLAVMSHELRTPLNAIIGYSDLLLLGVPDNVPDGARRQVERIRSASDSLLQLVEEVLSFSRIDAGKEEIRISPVDLSALLRETIAMVEPLAAAKALPLRVDLPAEPLRLVSDEQKIRQIMTNLLSNAVKFTEQGEIVVCAVSEETEIRIEVRDTGIGIPSEHLDRIFDPFWQVEQVSTRRFGGTGLGLGVARRLASLLEGRLEVDSEVGRGSTFTLALPRRTPGMGRNG